MPTRASAGEYVHTIPSAAKGGKKQRRQRQTKGYRPGRKGAVPNNPIRVEYPMPIRLLIWMLTTILPCRCFAEDWTQWRGEDRAGLWQVDGLVESFPTASSLWTGL